MPCSDHDALPLDLLNPFARALLRQIRLVVLVKWATHEVVAADLRELLSFGMVWKSQTELLEHSVSLYLERILIGGPSNSKNRFSCY